MSSGGNAYDAVIAGAGPAGAVSALLLARAGVKVLLLERNPQFRRKVCGEYLCPKGVELLRELGAGQVLDGMLPVYGIRMVSPSGRTVQSGFPGGVAGASVPRDRFDGALAALARDHGAEVRLGCAVGDVVCDSARWKVVTSHGEFHARFLVGADGRGSRISRIFGNEITASSRRIAIRGLVTDQTPCGFGEMHLFNDGAYIGLDRTGEREINLSLVCDSPRMQELGGPAAAVEHYVNSSPDLSARLNARDLPVDTAFPIQHRVRSVTPARNVALAGDAAGLVDPLTGEGMYNAILSASLLCAALTGSPENFTCAYQTSYVKHLGPKMRLNRLFQTVIRRPWLVEMIATFLLRKPSRADTFVGMVGNIYSPGEGLVRLL